MNDNEIYKSNMYGKSNWSHGNPKSARQTISLDVLAQMNNARNISYTQDVNRARLLESEMMFKSAIEYGQMSIKGGMLLNGSAAIALLAFIGNIITQASKPHIQLSQLVYILSLFCYGSFASILGAGMAYFAQIVYQINNGKHKAGYKILGIVFHALSIICVLIGYCIFAYAVSNFSCVAECTIH